MLILTRRIGQTVCIGDDIKFTITRVAGPDRVLVGIKAPKGITILRKEISNLGVRADDKPNGPPNRLTP